MDDTRHLLSEEALNGDWQILSDRISSAILQIKQLDEISKSITFNIKGIDNLLVFSEMMQKAEATINNCTQAENGMKEATISLNTAMANYGKIFTDTIKKQSEYKLEIIESNQKISEQAHIIKLANEEIRKIGENKGFRNQKKEVDEWKTTISNAENAIVELESNILKANSSIKQLNPTLDLSAKGFRSQMTAINELEARVGLLTNSWKDLTIEQRSSQKNIDNLLVPIQELNIELTELRAGMRGVGTESKEMSILQQKEATLTARFSTIKSDEAKSVALLNVELLEQNRINKLTAQETLAVENSYKEMSAELALLDIKLKDYSLDQIKNGETTDANIIRYKQLVAQLKEYDAILGINTRNVGNYKSVLTPLAKLKLEMVDIQRKLTTGELAEGETTEILKNRYKELELEAKQVVAAQNEVNKSLNVGKSVMQQFGDMFYRQILRAAGSLIIFGVIFAAFQQLWKLFTEGTDKTIALRKEIEDYNTKLRELGDTAVAEAAKEEAAAKIHIATATNINNSITTRIESISELRKAYKGLFDDYSDEEIMNNKALVAYENLNKAIVLKAGIKANEGKIEESAKTAAEAQDKIEDLEGITKRAEEYLKRNLPILEKYVKDNPNANDFEQKELELAQLRGGVVQTDKLFENTPEGRLEKARLEKRSVFDKMFDKGTVKINENKDQIEEQKKIQDIAISNESDYLKRAQTNQEKLDKLTESKKRNIIQLKAELASLKSTIETRNLPQDVLDKFYDNSVSGKQFDTFLKKQKGSIDSVETQKLRDEYTKKEEKIRLMENELKDKTSHREGKNAPNETSQTEYQEYLKQEQRQIIESNKLIIDDSKQSLDKRLEAQTKYTNAKLQLLDYEHQQENIKNNTNSKNAAKKIEEIKNDKKTVWNKGEKENALDEQSIKINEAYWANEKANAAFLVNQKTTTDEGLKGITKIYQSNEKEWLDNERLAWDEHRSMVENEYQKQFDSLKDQEDKKLITKKQYNKIVADLQLSLERKLLKDGIDSDEEKLHHMDMADKIEVEKILEHQNNLKNRLNALNGGETKDKKISGAFPELEAGVQSLQDASVEKSPEDKLKDQLLAMRDFSTQAIQITQELENDIKTIKDNQFKREQQQLEIQMRTVQLQSQQQIQAINASVGYAITKQNQAALVVAQTTAQENNIRQQQNQLELKKAIADKQAAETGIELNTALAISKTLPLFVTNPALAAAEVALITGLGIEQYNAAASTPLPQFWKGGTYTGNRGFIAGERGFELITPPNAPSYFSTSIASVYKEPIGTKITAHDQTMAIVERAVYNVYARIPQEPKKDDVVKEVAKIIGNKFEEVGEDLQYTMVATRYRQQKDNALLDYMKRKDNLTSSMHKR